MKSMKRVLALVLAMVMCLGLATVASAAEKTGTITIDNASAGQVYTVYKVFQATYNPKTQTTAYTVAKDSTMWEEVEACSLFTLGAANSDDECAVIRKQGVTDEQILDWVKGLDVKKLWLAAQGIANGNTLSFEVPYGYYYITSSLGATVTVDTNTPDVNVIDKNTTGPNVPTDKDVKMVVDDEGNKIEQSNASINNTVKYQISFNATNIVTVENEDGTAETEKITEYKIVDTSQGLKIKAETVAVKIAGRQIEIVPTFENNVMTIVLPWIDNNGNSIYNSPSEVEITYDAIVTDGAQVGAATNSVNISYNGTQSVGTGQTETKTYSITISKVDANGTALDGAEFELYGSIDGDDVIALVKNADDTYRLATTEEQEEEGFVSAVVSAGNAVIKGLGNGSYYLEEIKAPEGYNKLAERKQVTIENASVVESVVNETGSTLPSTGGIGTTIFYVIGGILVIGAGVLLVTKKRMSHNG